MCSIGEDDFADDGGLHLIPINNDKDTINENNICKKCNVENVVVKLNLKTGQCKNCFLMYVRHKFRASLGSTKVVRRGSNVLLYFNGKPESVIMLDMIHYALEQEAFKRLHLFPKIIFIDKSCLFNEAEDKRINRLKSIQNILQKYPYESYYTSIGNTEGDSLENLLTFNNHSLYLHDEILLKETINSFTNLTTRQDFIRQLKTNMLIKIAKKIDCKFIFFPDIGTDLATTFLTNVALGRGGYVALDVSFHDDRHSGIEIIRPMRDININEIENYVALCNIECIDYKDVGQCFGIESSIQNLTKNFIEQLQKTYPSTVSTIFRTGDKIAPNKSKTSNADTEFCIFCKSYLDFKQSNTLFATEYSRYISKNLNNQTLDIEQLAENAVNGRQISEGVVNYDHKLCHGCRNIFRNCNRNKTEDILNEYLL